METKTIATIAGAAAAGGVLAFAGLNLATAATGSATPAATGYGMAAGQDLGPGGRGGPHGTPVTGDTLAKVTAAVTAKYPGATVESAEEEHGGYEAHVRKADGTQVHVSLDSDFQVTGEHQGPPMGGPGRGPGAGPGEKPLTGAKAAKVKAAAKHRIPNGKVLRVETDSDGVYEAHVVKKNGKEVVVSVNKRFQVTGVESMARMAR